MSLESMRNRISYRGGALQQDRMIKDKLNSMLSATKYSYQAARFSKYPELSKEVVGLFNPVAQNEDYDTKMISTAFENNYKVGDIFSWRNTDTYWIIFLQDKTELAYFRGRCRRCDYKVQWVDGNREVQETLISVIGPSVPTLRTSSSMQAKVAEDFPNANLKILIPDNEVNHEFFYRYQYFLLKGKTYIIEELDDLSMPGIISLNATEHYSNKVEDDVEEDLRNAWNILPVIPDNPTDYAIDGPSTVKPQFKAKFEAIIAGGQWVIVDNFNREPNKLLPAKFVELDQFQKEIHVVWDSMKSGQYTLGYQLPDGTLYQKHVLVESLM